MAETITEYERITKLASKNKNILANNVVTISHNIDNPKLSDADFRDFVRNTLSEYIPKK